MDNHQCRAVLGGVSGFFRKGYHQGFFHALQLEFAVSYRSAREFHHLPSDLNAQLLRLPAGLDASDRELFGELQPNGILCKNVKPFTPPILVMRNLLVRAREKEECGISVYRKFFSGGRGRRRSI